MSEDLRSPLTKEALFDILRDLQHADIAKLFLSVYDGFIIGSSCDDKDSVYVWDSETTLYKEMNKSKLSNLMQENLRSFINKDISRYSRKPTEKKKEQFNKKVSLLRKKCKDMTFVNNASKKVCLLLSNDDTKSQMDSNINVVNFNNGLVSLKNGKYRRRTPNDYYTKKLNYDYHKKIDNDLMEELEKMYYNICNDDKETTECIKEFLGYSMTGVIKFQAFLASIGNTGGNGKSILVETFQKCMHIYVTRLEERTFDPTYNKNHKQFANIRDQRLVFAEELPKGKINMNLLKNITGGSQLKNEIMYGTSEEINISFKVYIISNHNPKFANGGGIERRGRLVNHSNRFIDDNKPEILENKKGYYVRDDNLVMKFDQEEYKLTLFQMLLPYAMKIYRPNNKLFTVTEERNEKGEYIPLQKPIIYTKLHDNWIEKCGSNDKMAEFIDEYYEKSDDRVHKDDFLNDYRNHYDLQKVTMYTISEDINRLGYKYEKNLTVDGKKGVILGLKRNNNRIKRQQRQQNKFDDDLDD